MNEAVLAEYMNLCEQLVTGNPSTAENRLYARLDQLWYREMTDEDREEADKRLMRLTRFGRRNLRNHE